MMGLTDRVQPWARRFQRVPREPDAPKAQAPNQTERGPDRSRAEGEAAKPTRRRFVRRALQGR